jgi:hypothetical protein
VQHINFDYSSISFIEKSYCLRKTNFAIFARLKTTIAILFSLTYLFATTQLGELFKLPLMAEHFAEHQNENPKISFWNFICIHYMHGEVNDDDFDKDMKLPFKSHNSCSCSSITFLQAVPNYDLFYNIFFTTTTKTNFGYSFSFIPNYFSSIWQPPKIG